MGFPDYYKGSMLFERNPWGIAGGLGLSELAARLGSWNVYDRRGDVIWSSDFSDGGNAWTFYNSGTGGKFWVDTDIPYLGAYCAHIYAATNAHGISYPYLQIAPRMAASMGLEASINIVKNVDFYTQSFIWYDGTHYWEGSGVFDLDRGELGYIDSEGIRQTLDTGIRFDYDYPVYHMLKVVLDFREKEYERIMLNGKQYDMRGKGLHTGASDLGPFIIQRLIVQSQSNVHGHITLGHVITTCNEPPT